ncbi:MAG TPA: ABC transporter ATP-binding protein [Acidimicrobiales bacterium]|jgi:ABC-2 type transport system ATP-binding protein|nr:ABC transporter ATP-binding protein [Acidimicrobiales bacterium]
MSVAVGIEQVSKRFRLYQETFSSLKDKVLHMGRVPYEDFWALRDIDLEIAQGSTFGLLGHNGSGKSTMLKLVAGILQPTSGRILVRGRLAALLELGAGFQPELTGRENVFLNASLLGMPRREIERRFDKIVAFAELETFIDQQVKYYSSGMYVRLGFAVAVNVDPDVLLVDEVLAVGDENFQRKCIDRVQEFQRQGRTIVVVSHNADLIRRICDQAAVLDEGKLVAQGEPGTAIRAFHEHLLARQRLVEARALAATLGDLDGTAAEAPDPLTRVVSITEVSTDPPAAGGDQHLEAGQALTLKIGYHAAERVDDLNVWVNLHDIEGRLLFGYSTGMGGADLRGIEGDGHVEFRFAYVPLLEGDFMWVIGMTSFDGKTVYDIREQQDRLSVTNPSSRIGLLGIPTAVVVCPSVTQVPAH